MTLPWTNPGVPSQITRLAGSQGKVTYTGAYPDAPVINPSEIVSAPDAPNWQGAVDLTSTSTLTAGGTTSPPVYPAWLQNGPRQTATASNNISQFTVPAGVTADQWCLIVISGSTNGSAPLVPASYSPASSGSPVTFVEIFPITKINNSWVIIFKVQGLVAGNVVTTTLSSSFLHKVDNSYWATDPGVAIGTYYDRAGASGATVVAPSMACSVGDHITILSMERTTAVTTVTGRSNAGGNTVTNRYFDENSGSACSVDITEFVATGTSTGTSTVTYDTASGNGFSIHMRQAAGTAPAAAAAAADLTSTSTLMGTVAVPTQNGAVTLTSTSTLSASPTGAGPATALRTPGAAAVTTTNNTATFIDIASPVDVAVDDYIVAFVDFQAAGSNNDVTVTPADAGWTLITGGNDLGTSTSIRLNAYGRFAAPGDPSTWRFNYTAPSGGNASGFAVAVSNVDKGTPFYPGEVAYLAQVATTATRDTASVSIAGNRRILAAWADRGGSTWTVSGTQLQTARASGSVSVTAEDAGVKAAGTYTRTATASTSTSVASSVIVPLNPAYLVTRSTAKVDTFHAAQPFYVAHRGGSADYVECTQFAYDSSVAYGAKALEAPCWRTSDGVWVISHDKSTLRMFGTDLDITANTWATLSSLRTTSGNYPLWRLTDLLDAYGNTHILYLDNKGTTNNTAFLDLLDSYAGPDRYVFKNFWQATTQATEALGRGYRTWGYYYEADLPNLESTQGPWVLLGMEYSASQSAWNTMLAKNRWVLAHVCLNATQVTTGLGKGAHGAMTGKIVGVVPPASQGIAPLTSTSTLTAGASATSVAGATLTSTSTLTASAVRTQLPTVALASTSTLSATGSIAAVVSAAAPLASTSILAASGVVSQPATAPLASTSTLSASGVRSANGSVALTSTLTTTATAFVTTAAGTTLSSISTLTVAASLTQIAAVPLTSTSVLSTAGARTAVVASTLTSTSVLTTAGVITRFAAAPLTSTSTLNAAVGGQAIASASLLTTSTLSVAGSVSKLGVTNLMSTSVLTTTGIATKFGGAALISVSTLAVAGVRSALALAPLSSTSVLTAGSGVTKFGGVNLVSTSDLMATAVKTSASRFGWWDGTVVRPVNLLGVWNGTGYDPVLLKV